MSFVHGDVPWQTARVSARRTRRGLSQNFLRSRRLAEDIVRGLDVRPHELIVEIGAGDGRLTSRSRGGRAASSRSSSTRTWRRCFAAASRSSRATRCRCRCRREPFRVVGNVPFHRTTAILRRLLDDLDRSVAARGPDRPVGGRAEARGRRSVDAADRGVGAVVGARASCAGFDASAFEPRPDVDAALLRIVPREPALLPSSVAPAYRAFVRRAFAEGLRSVVPPLHLKRAAAAAGFGRTPRARSRRVPVGRALHRPFAPCLPRTIWRQPLMKHCHGRVTRDAYVASFTRKGTLPGRTWSGGCHRDGHATRM